MDNWAKFESLLLTQEQGGGPVDAVVEVAIGASRVLADRDDKVVVRGRLGSYKVVPYGVAEGRLAHLRHATITQAVAMVRGAADASGLRATHARLGKGKVVAPLRSPSNAGPSSPKVTRPSAAVAPRESPTPAYRAGQPSLPGQAQSTPAGFVAFAREQLRDILDLSGQVLYSGASTLRPGEVYLLGLNPGGDPSDQRLLTIRRSLDNLVSTDREQREKNSYVVTWPSSNTLRRRVVWLLERLGLRVEDVAASNLIFPRSRDEKSCQYDRYADASWAVHERILEIVQPRLVITYGNPPYRFLRDRFGTDSEQRHPSGHGKWPCRSFDLAGRFRVVSLPHLSLYAIDRHPEVVDWIESLA